MKPYSQKGVMGSFCYVYLTMVERLSVGTRVAESVKGPPSAQATLAGCRTDLRVRSLLSRSLLRLPLLPARAVTISATISVSLSQLNKILKKEKNCVGCLGGQVFFRAMLL